MISDISKGIDPDGWRIVHGYDPNKTAEQVMNTVAWQVEEAIDTSQKQGKDIPEWVMKLI